MDYPANVWNQLKNVTVEKLMKALEADGWIKGKVNGARHPYIKREENGTTLNRIVLHHHPKKTYGPKLLKGLLGQIGWSIEDLKRLKLIK